MEKYYHKIQTQEKFRDFLPVPCIQEPLPNGFALFSFLPSTSIQRVDFYSPQVPPNHPEGEKGKDDNNKYLIAVNKAVIHLSYTRLKNLLTTRLFPLIALATAQSTTKVPRSFGVVRFK